MINLEETLLLIKPDGVEKKLFKLIASRIFNLKLKISQISCCQLEVEDVEFLYKGNGLMYDQYCAVESFMVSGPVIILLVTGENAVKLVKYGLVGKYDRRQGLRWEFGETPVKNVAHAPENATEALQQITYFFLTNSQSSY